MKRFTERDKYGNADIIGVSGCNLGGNLNFEELNRLTRALNRLAELEDKLESGQLVELPCGLEDKLFIIHLPKCCTELIECIIGKMEFTGSGWEIKLYESGFGSRSFVCFYDLKAKVFSKGVLSYKVSYPQDTVFVDKAQAEARLKELQEKL